MTNEQLNEIENLRLAATGGNWQHQRWPCLIWEGDGSESELCAAIGPLYAKAEQPNREQVYADAKFIVAMSEHALPLVKAVREAWAAIADARIEAQDSLCLNLCLRDQLHRSRVVAEDERDLARAEAEVLARDRYAEQQRASKAEKERDEARAEVERLRGVVRQVHALTTEETAWETFPGMTAKYMREIHKITKEIP